MKISLPLWGRWARSARMRLICCYLIRPFGAPSPEGKAFMYSIDVRKEGTIDL